MDGAAAAASAKPWLQSYPPAVPPEIDLDRLGTLVDMLRDGFGRYADRPAYESFGVARTYAQIAREAEAFAAWLQSEGFKKGDRVALMMPNVMAYPATMFGVLLGGFTVVNVNPLYTARELTHQLNDSGAKCLVVLENFAHTAAEALPQTGVKKVVVAAAGDLIGLKGQIVNLVARHVKKVVPPYSINGSVRLPEVLAHGRRRPLDAVSIGPDDAAFLQYTGGTTGVSKGAVLLHRNIAANVAQCESWLGWALKGDTAHVMVTALPLYHIFALTACGLLMLRIGASCLLIANPRDIPGFISTLRKTRFTMFAGVNTLYNALANNPDIKTVDFSKLKFCIAGGMAMQKAVAERWFALTGCAVAEGYGLSETSPVVTCNRPDLTEYTGTIGLPVPSTEVSVRSLDGRSLPMGEPGELCVRGPQVMAGYWQRPDETAKVMTADGFFRTGDIGVLLPTGHLKIVDRIKDMVLVSGFNVYPNEVEDVIAAHPGVLEVAVVGLPDPQSGEAVSAFIVRKDPALDAEALRAFCREQLTGYKVPRHIIFRETLPKTNVGKVLRRALREEAMAGTTS